MPRATGLVSVAALVAVMSIGTEPAAAQGAGIPAEFPPASYTGTQYVDSQGCAFVRAGMAGRTTWVPRVSRQREQLCNFQPTGIAAAQAAAPAPRPDVTVIVPPDAPAAARVAAAPRVVLPPVPRAQPAMQAARSPAVRQPAPILVPVVAQVPTSAPAPQRRVTLAEACLGRFGVQPGFVSASTRQPIDCGPAAAPAQRVAAGPMARTAGPAPLRLTLADACARQAQTGQRLIDAASGRPIACAPASVSAVAQVAYPARIASATGCAAAPAGVAVRCGPQIESPSGTGTTLYAPLARAGGQGVTAVVPPPVVVAAPRPAKPLFGAGPVPASNAPNAAIPHPPRGYARVWDDGRINPQRGLPRAQVVVAAPAHVQATVSSRSAAPAAVQAPAAASGPRYVQVGSFGDPANAARLIARLQAAGLPVASAQSGGVKVIAAGPFRSPGDLNAALGVVRGMGFSDAYLRS
ncbi:SPOR domain-containing protein [Loktanella fryxellensis]|nr:SPOR domain-containing protein [Loktanella fryxellensis]